MLGTTSWGNTVRNAEDDEEAQFGGTLFSGFSTSMPEPTPLSVIGRSVSGTRFGGSSLHAAAAPRFAAVEDLSDLDDDAVPAAHAPGAHLELSDGESSQADLVSFSKSQPISART